MMETGIDYIGRINKTISGHSCQQWDSQFPHSHVFSSEDFPDDSIEEASNFCRNPDKDDSGTWCFTTDPHLRWDFCDVPMCCK